jgi:hypothetical protein
MEEVIEEVIDQRRVSSASNSDSAFAMVRVEES